MFKTIKDINAKNPNQETYLENIANFDVTFGVGPAGTGKTYLAIYAALLGLQSGKYKKLILTRPAVEADESLGYLPGSLEEKLAPYLRPLYDAIEDIIGRKELDNLIDSGYIEITPLAYMRGRTLNDSFIILDEAQNTTISQLKMFLTRIGFGSKMIITGDIRQSDLKGRENNGLKEYTHKLKPLFGTSIGHIEFDSKGIIRHPIITEMLKYI